MCVSIELLDILPNFELAINCLIFFTREIAAELEKLTALLDKMHAKIAGKYDEVRACH